MCLSPWVDLTQSGSTYETKAAEDPSITKAYLDKYEAEVREAFLARFAEHHSFSVQHTLHLLAEAVFEARADVEQIHLRLPNVHHLSVDLARLGLDDPEGTIFVATEAPFGVIEGTFSRV